MSFTRGGTLYGTTGIGWVSPPVSAAVGVDDNRSQHPPAVPGLGMAKGNHVVLSETATGTLVEPYPDSAAEPPSYAVSSQGATAVQAATAGSTVELPCDMTAADGEVLSNAESLRRAAAMQAASAGSSVVPPRDPAVEDGAISPDAVSPSSAAVLYAVVLPSGAPIGNDTVLHERLTAESENTHCCWEWKFRSQLGAAGNNVDGTADSSSNDARCTASNGGLEVRSPRTQALHESYFTVWNLTINDG